MIIYVVGSGASEGTPLPGLKVKNTSSYKEKDFCFEKRRNSAYVFISDKEDVILVDAGSSPFHCVKRIPKAILISHWHSDHTQALLSIRWIPKSIPIFCPYEEKEIFPILNKKKKALEFHFLKEDSISEFRVGSFNITCFPLNHGSTKTLGFLIKDDVNSVLYLTDTKGLPKITENFLGSLRNKVDASIVDATYSKTPDVSVEIQNESNHNNLQEALTIGEKYSKKVFLTHIPPYAPGVLSLHTYLRVLGYENTFIVHDGMIIQP